MKTFVITYPNGYIELNVNNYFVKATLPNIKKMFKFARLYCTEKYKAELIRELQNSKKYWNEVHHKVNIGNTFWINSKIKSREQEENCISPITRELAPNTEKQRRDLQAKLDRIIEILKAEKWGVTAL